MSKEKLICPVCKKEFYESDETKYLIGDNLTCSWKCFKDFIAKKEKEKKILEQNNKDQPIKKRGRKKKNEKV